MQAGSSIMPGKINPVIPEAVVQVAIRVMGNDQMIAQACSPDSDDYPWCFYFYIALQSHIILISKKIANYSSFAPTLCFGALR